MFTAEFHAASDYLLASDHIYWCYFLTNKKKMFNLEGFRFYKIICL